MTRTKEKLDLIFNSFRNYCSQSIVCKMRISLLCETYNCYELLLFFIHGATNNRQRLHSTRGNSRKVKVYAISSSVASASPFFYVVHERKNRRSRPQFRHEEARPSHEASEASPTLLFAKRSGNETRQ